MKRSQREISFRYFMLRVLAGFLVVYLLTMSLFTYSQQRDIRKKYKLILAYERVEICNEIEQIFEKENKQPRQTDLRLALRQTYCKEYPIYFKAKLYEENEEIARTGHYLESYGNVYNDYIDLDMCLEDEELLSFIKVLDNKEWISRRIRVIGYRNKESSEVFPKEIILYKGENNYKENHTQKDSAHMSSVSKEAVKIGEEKTSEKKEESSIEKVIKLDTHVEQEPNIEFYDKEDEWWLLGQSLNYSELISKKYLNRLDAVERNIDSNMDKWKKKRDYIGEEKESIIQVDYVYRMPIKNREKTYRLILGTRYYPLEIAIMQLKSVYIFSLIAILFMSVILAFSLWKNELRAQELEEKRKRTVDAIGHELKTPLTLLRTYSEALRDKVAEEKKTHYLEVIMDEVDRMDKLIVQMLTLSKIEKNVNELNKETFCLNELAHQIVERYQELIDEKKIKIKFEEKETIEVWADRNEIELVISNLLTNAIRYGASEGEIYICLADKVFSIENTGSPIKEEHMKGIWEPFFKGESGDNRTGSGTGLGLSIVRQILEGQHWKYGVCNTNRGVKFWFEM